MPAIKLLDTTSPTIELQVRQLGKSCLFLLDTGAEISMLEAALVDDIKTKKNARLGGVGEATTRTVGVQFSLLHKTLTEVIQDPSLLVRHEMARGHRLSGILGMDLLGQFSSITFDNKNKTFRFEL